MAEDGIYRPSRRLEALRCAGIAERIDADQWRIPDDFDARRRA